MEAQRLDVWLDIACLFRTRSEAQKACKMGRVAVNGQAAKPNREVRPGDEIVVSRPGRKQTVFVRAMAERHIAKADARTLYEDRTPPPTPEEIEVRRMERLTRALSRARPVTPDKRDRRRIRRMKEGSDR
jgi:ribosome-associated heat shock protein Hsp15